MFKSLYKSGEYEIKGSPYKLRGAVLPRTAELADDLNRKKKEESAEERLERQKTELEALDSAISERTADLKALQDEYAEQMMKTEEDVKNLLADAEKQASDMKEEAGKKGFDEGYEKGYFEGISRAKAEVEQKYSGLLSSIKGIAETAVSEKHKIIASTEDDVIDLAIDIAKKVVNREIKADREIVAGLVKEAIKRLEDKEKIIIYAHPQDIDLIKAHRAEFTELVDAADSLHILPDDILEPGECRLESKSEIIDTDINHQFGEIKKKLSSGE